MPLTPEAIPPAVRPELVTVISSPTRAVAAVFSNGLPSVAVPETPPSTLSEAFGVTVIRFPSSPVPDGPP